MMFLLCMTRITINTVIPSSFLENFSLIHLQVEFSFCDSLLSHGQYGSQIASLPFSTYFCFQKGYETTDCISFSQRAHFSTTFPLYLAVLERLIRYLFSKNDNSQSSYNLRISYFQNWHSVMTIPRYSSLRDITCLISHTVLWILKGHSQRS